MHEVNIDTIFARQELFYNAIKVLGEPNDAESWAALVMMIVASMVNQLGIKDASKIRDNMQQITETIVRLGVQDGHLKDDSN